MLSSGLLIALEEKPDFASNTVMNYGVMLQYERDFHDSMDAKNSLKKCSNFLNESVVLNRSMGYSQP